eukprot:m.51681 g.51681  ORF g.51681 m.51681 type:complete len:422 (-) comp13449_c0_seq1:72-1337(-)
MAGKRHRHALSSSLEEGELQKTASLMTVDQSNVTLATAHLSDDGPILCSSDIKRSLQPSEPLNTSLEEGELPLPTATTNPNDGAPPAKKASTCSTIPSADAAPQSQARSPISFNPSREIASHSHSDSHSDELDPLNPPVVVLPAQTRSQHRDPKTVYVIRDDVLPGGTKQRATALLFNQHDDTYVYAGPVFGFAQLALTVCANARGKYATVIVARQRSGQLHPLTARAASLGAHVVERGYPNRLKDIQAFSRDYVRSRRRTYLLPFGLDCETFIQGLVDKLRVSLPAHLLTRPPKRLWLVAGSATLLAAFARLWPSTHFLVVQVGKTVWPDQLGIQEDGSKKFEAKLHVAPEKFWETALQQPPYPSVSSYDAKLWQFVEQQGEDGDFVWNVAANEQTQLTKAEEQAASMFREEGADQGARL